MTEFPLAGVCLVCVVVASRMTLQDVHNACLIRAGVMIFFMAEPGKTTLFARASKTSTDDSTMSFGCSYDPFPRVRVNRVRFGFRRQLKGFAGHPAIRRGKGVCTCTRGRDFLFLFRWRSFRTLRVRRGGFSFRCLT